MNNRGRVDLMTSGDEDINVGLIKYPSLTLTLS